MEHGSPSGREIADGAAIVGMMESPQEEAMGVGPAGQSLGRNLGGRLGVRVGG